jgi:uncharacterized membrane protein
MAPISNRLLPRFGRWLRRTFIAGLLVTVPIGITIWIIVWLFDNIDGFLQQFIFRIFGRNYWGVGFAVTVVIVFVVGVIANNMIGRRIVRLGESMLDKVPIIRPIYTALREIFQSFNTEEMANGYIQVVLVEFPTKGMRTLGFITNEAVDPEGKKLISVFIPHAPNPMTGYMEIVREESIIRTELSVEEALKMVVSAGRMMPRGFKDVGWVNGVKQRGSTPSDAPVGVDPGKPGPAPGK